MSRYYGTQSEWGLVEATVPCWYCKAIPGEKCRTMCGRPPRVGFVPGDTPHPHTYRWRYARAVLFGCGEYEMKAIDAYMAWMVSEGWDVPVIAKAVQDRFAALGGT